MVFHGLDTFAEIFLNGQSLGRGSNMLVSQEFATGPALVNGDNQLMVVIDPVKTHVPAEPDPKMWYSYDPDRVWVRKAQFGWRWDWGPRLVTAGLWRDVELLVPGRAEIIAIFFRTHEVGDQLARVRVSLEAQVHGPGAEAEVRLGELSPVRMKLEDGKAETLIEVPDPKLWWTHDLGNPHLYDLEVTLVGPEGVLDSRTEKVGIRTLELRRKAPDGTNLFQFVLNGVPQFARGANWVPAHSFVGTVGDDDYRAWIDLARQGNMTMLRVWGGGLYEKPAFYQECDRQGLLVWQLSDCWPTLSWSVVDFHRRPKAGYWALKRAFAPLLLSWREERPNVVGLWMVNDRLEGWEGAIEVELADFFNHRIFHTVVTAFVPSLSSVKVSEFSKNLMNVTYSNFEYLAARPLVPGPEAALFLFEDHKNLNLGPAVLSVRWGAPVGGLRRIGIVSDRFARMVRLEGDLDGLVLSDNYFDLEPGRLRTLSMEGDFELPRGLRVAAINADVVSE